MATKTWLGGTTAVAGIKTVAIGDYDASTTYTLTVTGEDGTTVAISTTGVTDAAGTGTALAAAWNASVHPFVSFVTASGTSTVTLTVDSAYAGRPLSVASSVSGGTGTIGSVTVSTVSQGPYDYGTAANWAEGVIPAANDDVTITGSNNIVYGLGQASIELDEFHVAPGCTAQIGTPQAKLRIDMGDGEPITLNGTGLVYLSISSAAVAPIIRSTKTVTGNEAGLYLTGTGITVLTVESGTVQLDACTVATTQINTNATVFIPVGNSMTTIHNLGGRNCVLGAAATTVNHQSGTLTTEGSGAITTLNVDGGTVTCNSTGTITTLNADGGTADFLQSRTARTVTTANARGGVLKYDPAVVTITNAIVSTLPISVSKA